MIILKIKGMMLINLFLLVHYVKCFLELNSSDTLLVRVTSATFCITDKAAQTPHHTKKAAALSSLPHSMEAAALPTLPKRVRHKRC